MKIQNVIVHVIQAPLGGENDQFCFSQGWVTCRSSVIVEVITQDGESGFATIGSGVYIGDGAKIGPNAMIENNVKDGDVQW